MIPPPPPGAHHEEARPRYCPSSICRPSPQSLFNKPVSRPARSPLRLLSTSVTVLSSQIHPHSLCSHVLEPGLSEESETIRAVAGNLSTSPNHLCIQSCHILILIKVTRSAPPKSRLLGPLTDVLIDQSLRTCTSGTSQGMLERENSKEEERKEEPGHCVVGYFYYFMYINQGDLPFGTYQLI